MKHTLLDQNGLDNIIRRAEKLQVGNRNLWGQMNITEMLLHCTMANKFILEDKSDYRKTSLKEKLIRIIALYIIPRFPRNRRGPLKLNTKGKIDIENFDAQRKEYIETIKRFPLHGKPFTSIHPGMGFLNNKEWSIAAWMHMDHHLRQFGV